MNKTYDQQRRRLHQRLDSERLTSYHAYGMMKPCTISGLILIIPCIYWKLVRIYPGIKIMERLWIINASVMPTV